MTEPTAPDTTDETRHRAAARVLYEATPEATIATVAEEMGLPVKLVKRWKEADQWRKVQRRLPDLAGRAEAAADAFYTTLEDTGKDIATAADAREVAKEAAARFAVDLRAEVLDRHKREWAGPRKLAYKAMRKADEGHTADAFETARVAKVLAETLTLVQAGECRAHNINPATQGPLVIIDRDE